MAKRPQPSDYEVDPRKSTARQDSELANVDLDASPTVNTGLGLRKGTLDAVDLLARRLGISKNALIVFAIRYVITAVRDGQLDIEKFIEVPPEPKRDIRLPK